jgi:hypothetical protein
VYLATRARFAGGKSFLTGRGLGFAISWGDDGGEGEGEGAGLRTIGRRRSSCGGEGRARRLRRWLRWDWRTRDMRAA